ncbi:hypothetical protein BDY17DRAFT_299561 [Neohortaea acidophila]|uniref:SH3 domain-containing protein n=1 Tax=Neohortaea acidophila TaxID=245834 RepID=A0A6A6PNR6_9PEZI|nr:uncharacterized protein BDY17DRAFT_299561 [Neohortaea acidophila]KAF2481738.1 hypothetical protein BDY17DRAFT_299561 [Neohortaea acidophila]
MKSVQRNFGRIMKRSANEADVASVIADFKAVDDMLERLIKDLIIWRNAWEDIFKFQYDTAEAFAVLYKPIEATGETTERRHRDEQTPDNYLQKCLGLQKEYSEERAELAQEIETISYKLIRPAEEAKQRTTLLHKTLKHRDNMKLDYERYLSRVEHTRKKDNRSAKDEANLQSQEASLAQSKIDYQSADDHVRQTFPDVTAGVLSLLPPLLEQQVRVHTTLVGQLYTYLDEYTRKYGFANPAPSDSEIVRTFESEFTAFRKELESGITVIARGKTPHMSMSLPADKDKGTVTGLGLRNKVTGLHTGLQSSLHKKDTKPAGLPSSSGLSSSPHDAPDAASEQDELAPPRPPRPGRTPSPLSSSGVPTMNKLRMPSSSSIPTNGTHDIKSPPPYDYKTTAATPPSRYQTPANGASPLPTPQSGLGGNDYFSNAANSRRPSANSIASSAASIAAAKKKPPPPVPAKRLPSVQSQFVTALYDFEGQSAGDLTFREGDRIRVVKKTDSQEDWWDGELKGRTGAFPANYVKIG